MSSTETDKQPWVVFNDCREWEISSLDTWGSANDILSWVKQHNCVYFAALFSNKVQEYAAEKEMDKQDLIHFYFNHDEAYQACLDELAKAMNQNKK